MKGNKMKNLTFSDKAVTITGRDANVLAGFAIVGIAVSSVTLFRICYVLGEKVGEVVYDLRHKKSSQLH
jgi:hypothetical protein